MIALENKFVGTRQQVKERSESDDAYLKARGLSAEDVFHVDYGVSSEGVWTSYFTVRPDREYKYRDVHKHTIEEIHGSSLNPEPGRKDDAGKLPYDLLPWGAVAEVVAVLQYGAKKYAPGNWKQVKDWRRRYFAAACRHMISWVTGEKLDPETGLHHLAHAGCCILFMIELDK